ncbi:MAG: hypothetical protein PUP91_39190 [Rhizonema sp. PD37]|nr:hypothetical protein [Rhizonema sp. PD37]
MLDLERVKKSILFLAKIKDIDPETKTKIMILFETPEWEHHEELIKLVEKRSQAQKEVLALLADVSVSQEPQVKPDKKLGRRRKS